MKLFLAAESKHPDSLTKLQNFTGGLDKKTVVYIPTAANGEYYGSWKGGESIQVAQSLGADLRIVELENSAYTNVLQQIGQPDVLWIAGGMSGYLLYWMRRTKLDQALPSLLKKTLYVGSSAGVMVCSQTQNVAEWFLADPEPGAGLGPGLGLIDFEVYPHYEDELYDQIKQRWTNGKLYLLKNGEVITVVDDQVQVLGEERIIVK